ncbi:hypothetical protein [Fenollaria massiliensis]|uniref:hypothetical protein n=1 Tax=Fenollaria massiliensis TaxID=938288 RepID=UPI00035DDF7A|nr:hypothetical protein [Fenollaria massiliensis]
MSKGIYKEKLSSYELENMDVSELKERIRMLEDELGEKLSMNDVTVRVMCEYIKDIEEKFEFTKDMLSTYKAELEKYREIGVCNEKDKS